MFKKICVILLLINSTEIFASDNVCSDPYDYFHKAKGLLQSAIHQESSEGEACLRRITNDAKHPCQFAAIKSLWNFEETPEEREKLVELTQNKATPHYFDSLKLLWESYEWKNFGLAASHFEAMAKNSQNQRAFDAATLLWKSWNPVYYRKGAALLKDFIENGDFNQKTVSAELLLNSIFFGYRIDTLLKLRNLGMFGNYTYEEMQNLGKLYTEYFHLERLKNPSFIGIEDTENGCKAFYWVNTR